MITRLNIVLQLTYNFSMNDLPSKRTSKGKNRTQVSFCLDMKS